MSKVVVLVAVMHFFLGLISAMFAYTNGGWKFSTDEADLAFGALVVAFWPLFFAYYLVAGTVCGVRTLAVGFRDLYREVRPKRVEISRASVVERASKPNSNLDSRA